MYNTLEINTRGEQSIGCTRPYFMGLLYREDELMSIAAKQLLLKEVEKELGSTLTVKDMEAVMLRLNSIVTDFEVEQHDSLNSDSEEFLNAFLEAKEIEGRSPKTLTRYKYIIERFLADVHTSTSKVTIYHLRSFLMSEKRRGISDRTLEGFRSVFSSYYGWLHKEGLIQDNPCANLGPIKCIKVIREPYSSADIERLKEACKSLRDRTIIMFLLTTGCRISEMCGLNRADIDFQSGECTVLGKGNKQRVVYLDGVAIMLLRRYLNQRTDLNPALFVGARSERLEPGGVRAMLKVLEKKTGVHNVHPHRFRRTLATNLITHGMPIQEVAAILGHDKLDTTMKYVYLEHSAVKNSYRKFA